MDCHDPNCVHMYFDCSNVCGVASGLLTREAGTIEQRFSFFKTEIVLQPVYTLNSQGL